MLLTNEVSPSVDGAKKGNKSKEENEDRTFEDKVMFSSHKIILSVSLPRYGFSIAAALVQVDLKYECSRKVYFPSHNFILGE